MTKNQQNWTILREMLSSLVSSWLGFFALLLAIDLELGVTYFHYGVLREHWWRSVNYWPLPSRTFYAAGRNPGGSGYSWGWASRARRGRNAAPCVCERVQRGGGVVLLLLRKLRTEQAHPVQFPLLVSPEGGTKKSPARRGSHSTSHLVPVTRKCSSPNLWEFQCSGVMVMPPLSSSPPFLLCSSTPCSL